MVLAFLAAEIDSTRFAHRYRSHMDLWQLNRHSLIEQADLDDPHANNTRRHLLKVVRGFGENLGLFNGFPDDTRWRHVDLTTTGINRLKYANFETWLVLSAGTRRVVDGAANVDRVPAPENANANIRSVAERLRLGHVFPALVAVEGPDGDLVLVEGHTRATAQVIVGDDRPLRMLLGSSSRAAEWAYF